MLRSKTIGPRPRLLLALPLAAALLAAGCRAGEEKPNPENTDTPAAAEAPRRGGTAVVGWTAEPTGVNEYIQQPSNINSEILDLLFLRLVWEQPDFTEHPPTFAPQLARSYEWSEDHKTLIFHLRDDVVWSDGVPVTAEDVRWTWQAQMHPDVAWVTAYMKERITDVEVVDPRTVRFHFSQVYARQLLDVNEGRILPKHVWEKLPFSKWRESADWFRQNLVVSGPFTLASWEPQQQFVLARNDRYYEKGLPRLDRLVLRVVPDATAGLTQLLSGDVDLVPQIATTDVPRIQASDRFDLITYWSNLYVFVGWNNERPLFADPEVRRALTLATDRQAIVDTILGQYGRVGVSPVLTTIWAYDRSLQPLPYDPAEARRILAARGWRDSDGDGVLDKGGKPFAFELASNAGNQLRADAAVMIQDQLKKVGIRVDPKVLEFNTLITRTQEGDFDAAVIGLSIDTGLDLTANFHSREIGGGSNYVRYRNPEMDRLLEEAAGKPEIAGMKPALLRIQQILHRDQPITVLWESQRLTAVNERVRNVKPNSLRTMYNAKEWWVARPAG
jgi:peptide/nickel transport system substrate-binding protein